MIGYTARLGKCCQVLCHAHMLVCLGNSTACWEFRPERRCRQKGDDVGSDTSHAWTGVCVCEVPSFKFLFCTIILWVG